MKSPTLKSSLPYILELQRVFTKTAGKVRLQQVFQRQSGEAKEAILQNTDFLDEHRCPHRKARARLNPSVKRQKSLLVYNRGILSFRSLGVRW